MKYLLRIFLILSIFFAGCAYPTRVGNYYSQDVPVGKSLIYLYRIDSVIDSANHDVPRFYINEKYIGKLLLRGHFLEEVDAGDVEVFYKDTLFGIPLPWTNKKVQFKAEAGQRYFVKFAIEGEFRSVVFKVVSEKLGESETKTTQRLLDN